MILYSILVYILLLTQAPIPVCLDDTIIDSSTILVTMYYCGYVGYDWWLCMVINISVQYSGGLLPDIILLTQGYYQWGTRLNTMYQVPDSGFVFIYSLCNVYYYYHV